MKKITYCIPSKSNLQYLKSCIPSIRENAFRKDHDIIIFVDSDEDGTIEWLESVKDEYNIQYYVNPEIGKTLYGIGMAYDYCIQKSTTDIFTIFHADMILGKNADLKAFEQLKPGTVVCSTRIEPPLHPNAGEKILIELGMYPDDMNYEKFNAYVESQLNSTKITEGIFAPWMMYKSDFEAIGGHDPRMHSCREDSDIFNRMMLAGYQFKQVWSSLVYHFTGRGAGSFGGDKARHEAWQRDMNNSTKEFVRKWGSGVQHTALMKPIVQPVYDIGLVITNCNDQLLNALEIWCKTMYVDINPQSYIEQEQPNTVVLLSSKIQDIKTTPWNDIVVYIDGKQFSEQDYQIIQQLPLIINNSGSVGAFVIGTLKIEIKKIQDYQNDLIKL